MKRDESLYFSRGYKYVVKKPYHFTLDIKPEQECDLMFLKMDMEGNILVLPGYPWDGASGPTWDTLNSMKGSLIHDVGYRLIRLCYINSAHKSLLRPRATQCLC